MKKTALLVLCLFGLTMGVGLSVQAQENADVSFDVEEIFPGWGDEEKGGGKLQGVIGNNTDDKILMNYIPTIINIFLKFVSPAILIVLIIAGVQMIIAGDDSEQVEKSKNVIKYCVIGVLLILLSYSIMRAVYYFFVGDEGGAPQSTSQNMPQNLVSAAKETNEKTASYAKASDAYGKAIKDPNTSNAELSRLKSESDKALKAKEAAEEKELALLKAATTAKKAEKVKETSSTNTAASTSKKSTTQGGGSSSSASQSTSGGSASNTGTATNTPAATNQNNTDSEKELTPKEKALGNLIIEKYNDALALLKAAPKRDSGCIVLINDKLERFKQLSDDVETIKDQNDYGVFMDLLDTTNIGSLKKEIEGLYDKVC